ncbi:hypothetical protein IWQ47_000655 [Aquimarina sp. EL_43]|uniref:hypothetical protein n=1 Tax=Aquimarina TaxID=290174 RepID=UPI000472F45B|nr:MULTISPECIES: hypothetical protein [Aquimarina]MBG6128655.1 hypothetical protein [Aquimarina sp. EL_35]MBG6149718.1 hypothetical protein [Aquimarina sp. EL_32]MBG6167597.1 hypothetical protein [Aquimarina sp. EL_43]
MAGGITLILLSIIVIAPSLLLSKTPKAKEFLEKIEPLPSLIRLIIGIIFCFWGVWGVISATLNLEWITTFPIWWITILVGNIMEALLGFMLVFRSINKFFLSKNRATKEKANQLREKSASKQGKLGVLGIIIGCWQIVASFLFFI